jgi:hypothetical protein
MATTMESNDYLESPITDRGRETRTRKHLQPFDVLDAKASPPSSPELRHQSRQSGALGSGILLGLSIGSAAATLLTTVYSIFYIDVFLNAYSLPLPTYSIGSLLFSIISTVSGVIGAWIVDHSATVMSRSDLVGASGCILAISFLAPFFRSVNLPPVWDGFHFVLSTSLYDTMFTFNAILMGSVVNDSHQMTDASRVQYMASGKALNLFASFIVAQIGLGFFNVDNLTRFRIFLTILSLLVAALFIIAQSMISSDNQHTTGKRPRQRGWLARLIPQARHLHDDSEEINGPPNQPPAKLRIRQVISDFRDHGNFGAWIGMEMGLEAQITFVSYFFKTFVDLLLLEAGFSEYSCHLLVSLSNPMKQVAAVFAYMPIQKYGYHRVYSAVFCCNIFLSATMLLVMATKSTFISYWSLAYLSVYPVITFAIQSAGFHLAQADMVLEMKQKHMSEARLDEPSLAGLFMGANALFCKPVESVLPIIAAQVLHRYGSSKEVLLYLLVIPPLVLSIVQLLAWRSYDLIPARTSAMRSELHKLRWLEHPDF